MKKHKNHLEYYACLGIILLTGFLLAIQFTHKTNQMFTVVVIAFFYVLWGILHHILHHNINTKIVIEYIIISSLGMTVVLFLLQTGV